jgi:putative transposase
LSTWYLYQRKLGIIRLRLPKKKKYSTGIIAYRPNQVWHADITIVKTKDNEKVLCLPVDGQFLKIYPLPED